MLKRFVLGLLVEFFVEDVLPEVTEEVSKELKNRGIAVPQENLTALNRRLAARIKKKLGK